MNFTLSANLKGLKSIFINDKEIKKDNYTIKDNVLTQKKQLFIYIKKTHIIKNITY